VILFVYPEESGRAMPQKRGKVALWKPGFFIMSFRKMGPVSYVCQARMRRFLIGKYS